MNYPTLVIDPPWKQAGGPAFDGRGEDTRVRRESGRRTNSRSKPLPYAPMTMEELHALPVATVAAPDAHLYCWVTNRYIEAVYPLVRAWGFKPVTLLTWGKPPMGMGLGGAYVQTSEHCLFARRGRDIRIGRSDATCWIWSRVHGVKSAIHSAKPEQFQDIVEQVSPGPYLELFARRERLGWDTWGDQSANSSGLVLATNPSPEEAGDA